MVFRLRCGDTEHGTTSIDVADGTSFSMDGLERMQFGKMQRGELCQ